MKETWHVLIENERTSQMFKTKEEARSCADALLDRGINISVWKQRWQFNNNKEEKNGSY